MYSINEDYIRKEFEFISSSDKIYDNDLYLENIKLQIFKPKSYTKEEFKKYNLS